MAPARTPEPPASASAGERDAAELSPAENAGLCAGCVRCCTYLSIAIDSPRASWEYDQWIWALHHERVAIYVERPEQWFIHFETRCRQLDDAGRCRIHGRHPMLCREYDPRSCERRHPLSHQRAWFGRAEDLEEWLARERPAHWARLMAWRRDTVPTPSRNAGGGSREAPAAAPAAASWVPLESVLAMPARERRPESAAGSLPAEALLPVHEEL